MNNTVTAFEKLGLSEEEIIEMQRWLYPILADNNNSSMADTIIKIVKKFPDNYSMMIYTLYHCGVVIGSAQVKEMLGIKHTLNPNEIR